MSKFKDIPDGKESLCPHLVVKDVAAAIEFYKKAFGAMEGSRLLMPGSSEVMHAGMRIGSGIFMLGSEMPGSEAKSPLSLGCSPVTIHFYVENVDEAFNKAINAGAQELMKPTDMFWGDRYGKLKDPFGHEWSLATHVKDLNEAEMQDAANEFFRQLPQSQPTH